MLFMGQGTSVSDLSNALLNLRFDVLVQAKEVLWVILLFDGHKPGVVWSECGFNRVFSLFTQIIQVVCSARERTPSSQSALPATL
jgi:hypothetical protein